MLDLILNNCVVVNEDETFRANIGVKNGVIAVISNNIIEEASLKSIDVTGYYVMPGAIDIHVHINDPGRSDWENWKSATKAAASGGITTIADMPLNSLPYVTDENAYSIKLKVAEKNSMIDFVLWGGIVDNNLDKLTALNKSGTKCFKAFLSDSGIDYSCCNDAILLEGLKIANKLNCFIGVHAETDNINKYYTQLLKLRKNNDTKSWIKSRPPISEILAAVKCVELARMTKGDIHICHIATPYVFDIINKAKSEGIKITGETCGHYLYFNSTDFEKKGALLKCAPPIRDEENRNNLWDKVIKGYVDIISSDHSPCTLDLKKVENGNIWKAWGGISGIETTLAVVLSEGVNKRGLSLNNVVKLLSANPAKRLGIYGKKGCIKVGADGDFSIIDLKKKWTVSKNHIYSKNQLSPYVGEDFIGKSVKTIIRGNLIFDNENFVNENFIGKNIIV